MKFVHDDPEFLDLLDIVASRGPVASAAMVEKDYWICHSLWALERSGLEFWFKSGTSLSKAFRIVPRFSEDIDLVILPGELTLPEASSWRTETARATASRGRFWQALVGQIDITGARVTWDRAHDPSQRNVGFRVAYPGHFVPDFQRPESVIRPYVLLEMSHGSMGRSARAPAVRRPVSSVVHEHLERSGQDTDYVDNRPIALRCVHPYVTLLEKLDAITRRYDRSDEEFEPTAFARHYGDVAGIIRHEDSLDPLSGSPSELAREMLAEGQIRRLVPADHPAILLDNTERRDRVERAYEALRPMYWEEPIPLTEALEEIVGWLRRQSFATKQPRGSV